ncbi:hypothetical protein SLA2020_262020 [Shorea laevis]
MGLGDPESGLYYVDVKLWLWAARHRAKKRERGDRRTAGGPGEFGRRPRYRGLGGSRLRLRSIGPGLHCASRVLRGRGLTVFGLGPWADWGVS